VVVGWSLPPAKACFLRLTSPPFRSTAPTDVPASANGDGGAGPPSQERKQRVYEQMEEYVARVKDLETQNRELRAQLQQQGGGGGGSSRPNSSSSIGSGWGSARVSSPVSKEVHKLRQENKALENKVKEARRENQELREQFNESFEDAKSKFRSQGRIHGNQMAAKKAEESSGQIAYLKDAVERLTKANKEFEAESRRLKKEKKDGPGLHQEVERLREELARAKELQAGLERNVENLQDEKENLERELEHQGEQKSLEVVEKGERSRVLELEAEVRELKEEVEGLRVDLEGRIYAEGEQDRLKEEVEELKARLKTASTKLNKQAQAQARVGGEEGELEQAREQVRREEGRCQELQEEVERLTKAQNAAEDRVRRLESSPSRTNGEARAAALVATLKEKEKELERLGSVNERLEQDVEALEANRTGLEEEVRNLNLDREAERKQAAKEKKGLQKEIDRLTGELEEADAKITQAQAEAAAAQVAAMERAASAEEEEEEEEQEEEREEEDKEEEVEVEVEVQRLQEENAELHREMETYRELAASQDQQFSLVYIQEVNTHDDYLMIGNRTNLDVSLAGWSLAGALSADGQGNYESQFEFPEDLMLSAGSVVTVWWGPKNLRYKLQPTRGNVFWEESDKIDIFQAQDDAVLLQDAEYCEMSRMRIISGKRRARAGPMAGSPASEAKRARMSFPPSPGGGGGGGGSGFGVRTLY